MSGSYDKTVRLWRVDSGRSRDVYHTKRMQRLAAVKWSLDDKFVLSARWVKSDMSSAAEPSCTE